MATDPLDDPFSSKSHERRAARVRARRARDDTKPIDSSPAEATDSQARFDKYSADYQKSFESLISPELLKRSPSREEMYHYISLVVAGTKVVKDRVDETIRARDFHEIGRIEALERKLAALEEHTLSYWGVFQKAITYGRGNCVTESGALWIAVRNVQPGEAPGKSDAWQLAVKSHSGSSPVKSEPRSA